MRVRLRCEKCLNLGVVTPQAFAVVGYWRRQPTKPTVLVATGKTPRADSIRLRPHPETFTCDESGFPMGPARSYYLYEEMVREVLGLPIEPFKKRIFTGSYPYPPLQEDTVPWPRTTFKSLHGDAFDADLFREKVLRGHTLIKCQHGHQIRLTYRQTVRIAAKAHDSGLNEAYI